MSTIVRVVLVVFIIVLALAGARALSNHNMEEARREGTEQARQQAAAATQRIGQLNQSIAMLDPTTEQWLNAEHITRIETALVWADAIAPNAPDEQAREFLQCIESAALFAPPAQRVRENIAAPCAVSLGW